MNRSRYHQEFFTGPRYGQMLRQVRKWLHYDALQCIGGDLLTVTFKPKPENRATTIQKM